MMSESRLDILTTEQRWGLAEREVEGKKGYKLGKDRAKGGAVALFREEIWEWVLERKETNEWLMYLKAKLGKLKLVIMTVYAPQA